MPLNYLIDANVLLDVLFDRDGADDSVACLLRLGESDALQAWIAPQTISIIYYVSRRQLGSARAKAELQGLLSWIHVVPQDSKCSLQAFEYDINDFEDALQVACAERVSAQGIITRNLKDFKNSPVRVYSPKGFLEG